MTRTGQPAHEVDSDRLRCCARWLCCMLGRLAGAVALRGAGALGLGAGSRHGGCPGPRPLPPRTRRVRDGNLAADGRERELRRRRLQRGALAELFAAVWLVLRGYRVLARRYRSRSGEIDIIAVRGRRLAFVEVKRRATLAEAEAAIADRQSRRIGATAEAWVWRHPAYRSHEIGLDAMLIVPGRLPRHAPNALQG